METFPVWPLDRATALLKTAFQSEEASESQNTEELLRLVCMSPPAFSFSACVQIKHMIKTAESGGLVLMATC